MVTIGLNKYLVYLKQSREFVIYLKISSQEEDYKGKI
jgi:hypothetical protein